MRQLFEAKDGTILNCSRLHPDGKIKACIECEKNLFDVDIDRATCWLPEYRWEDIRGFSSVEIAKTEKFIKSVIDQINESATAQSEEHPTYFSALNDPYTYGGVGNDLMNCGAYFGHFSFIFTPIKNQKRPPKSPSHDKG